MTKTLMKDIEGIVNKYKHLKEKYYILVHAKPYPDAPNKIKIKFLAMHQKPKMLLSCVLFGVNNETGTLTIEWALPGSWPVWSVGGTNEPVPEVIGSINKLKNEYSLDYLIPY
jgi:hypothetical protein